MVTNYANPIAAVIIQQKGDDIISHPLLKWVESIN